MEAFWSSDTESMTYKEDLQRVHAKIDRVIEQMGNAPIKPATNQWQIASTVLASIALIVAVLVGVYGHQSGDMKSAVKIEVGDQLREPLKQESAVAADIVVIKGRLDLLEPLVREMISKKLSASQNMKPAELKPLIQAAKQENITVPPATIMQIQKNLLATDPQAPDYWPTVATFITYRSSIGPWSNVGERLPDCTQMQAKATLAEAIGPGDTSVKITPFVYKDCQITLDSAAGSDALSRYLSLNNLIFQHCLIIYRGGVITLRPYRIGNEAKIHGTLAFEDCMFLLSSSPAPAPHGDEFLRTLLASSTNKVQFTFTPG